MVVMGASRRSIAVTVTETVPVPVTGDMAGTLARPWRASRAGIAARASASLLLTSTSQYSDIAIPWYLPIDIRRRKTRLHVLDRTSALGITPEHSELSGPLFFCLRRY